MRYRTLPAVGLGTLTVLLASTLSPAADASVPQVSLSHHVKRTGAPIHEDGLVTCYSQIGPDWNIAVLSQNFTDPPSQGYSKRDSRAADDFKIGRSCSISTLHVEGSYWYGPGPASSFKVTLYKSKTVDTNGMPGRVIVNCPSNAAYDWVQETGSLTIDLVANHCLSAPMTLPPGRYWVSVQANLQRNPGGQWGWVSKNTVTGYPSVWSNPRNGWGTGCTSWGTTTTCIPNGEGGDFMFELLG